MPIHTRVNIKTGEKTYEERPEIRTPDELLENKKRDLRQKREVECFSIINRGNLWYNSLTEERKIELQTWYDAWLCVTETLKVPEIPSWI